jgi:RNA polymerase sigma factor (sigma-70 family)
LCIIEGDTALRRAVAQSLSALDAQQVLLQGLTDLLHERDVAQAADCFVIDAGLRSLDGQEPVDCARRLGVRAPIILLSGPCDVGFAVRQMRAGAFDFLLTPVQPSALRQAVSSALDHAAAARQREARTRRTAQALEGLTPREREVLECVVSGLSNQDAAGSLHISIKTVEQHRARVMQKMRAASLAQLVAMVTEWQLMDALLAGAGTSRASGVAGGRQCGP